VVGNLIQIVAVGTTTITASQSRQYKNNAAADAILALTVQVNNDVFFRLGTTGNYGCSGTAGIHLMGVSGWADTSSCYSNENNTVYIQTGPYSCLNTNRLPGPGYQYRYYFCNNWYP
jgi:hypothetical protein